MFILLLVWSVVIYFSYHRTISKVNITFSKLAIQKASSLLNTIISFREWNSLHGGLYAVVDSFSTPNPYLISNRRDLAASDGTLLTLINPAYMTRQFFAILKNQTGISGKITSLKLLNPHNTPNWWEKSALKRFEKGDSVYISFDSSAYHPVLRYMKPLVTGKACLTCHSQQGYREGDVLGGISLQIPMEKYNSVLYAEFDSILKTHLFIWSIGVLFLLSAGFFVQLRLRENEDLTHQINQIQKLDSIGTLAGGVAHDFNNILTVILGYGEILSSQFEGDSKTTHRIEEILHSANRARKLTSQLLAFSRKQIAARELCDLNTVVSNMTSMLSRLIPENISLQFIQDENIPPIEADISQLEQIVMNLVINASDALANGYAEGNKRIIIETGTAYPDRHYLRSHPGARRGEFALLTVSDNGCGISPDKLDKIFDPFYTTKPKGKGTGLGLAMVYGIIKQNHGFIYPYSEVGKGTTFKIYWPLAVSPVGFKKNSPPATVSLQGSEIIYLVEDDKSVRKISHDALTRVGYSVYDFESGEDLFGRIGQFPDPHLLITDIVLTGMSGKDVAHRLAKLFSGVQVLFVSGYTDNFIVSNGFLYEGINFLSKPFTPLELSTKIRHILDKKKSDSQ